MASMYDDLRNPDLKVKGEAIERVDKLVKAAPQTSRVLDEPSIIELSRIGRGSNIPAAMLPRDGSAETVMKQGRKSLTVLSGYLDKNRGSIPEEVLTNLADIVEMRGRDGDVALHIFANHHSNTTYPLSDQAKRATYYGLINPDAKVREAAGNLLRFINIKDAQEALGIGDEAKQVAKGITETVEGMRRQKADLHLGILDPGQARPSDTVPPSVNPAAGREKHVRR